MVKVVFSNGSKALAHNLDDQYQRWQIRREELVKDDPYVNPEVGLEEFLPDLPTPTTPIEIQEQRDLLAEKQLYVQTRLAELNMQYRSKEIVRGVYEVLRAPLAVATLRLNLQIRDLNALKRGNKSNRDGRIKELRTKAKEGELSNDEQSEFDTLRFEAAQRSNDGVEKHLATADLDVEERFAKMAGYIGDLRKQLVTVQAKLIDAYERIIELESERG